MPEKPPLQLHGQAGEIPLWAEHQTKPRARRLLEHPTLCCPPRAGRGEGPSQSPEMPQTTMGLMGKPTRRRMWGAASQS